MKKILDYKNLYIKSARKYLEDLINNLSQLRENSDSTNVLKTLYLSAHSLKSESAVMNYKNTASLCNTIEEVFYLLKEKEILLSYDLIDSLIQSFEYLSQSLDSIEKENREINLSLALNSLQHLVEVKHSKED